MNKFERATAYVPMTRKEYRKQVISAGGTKKYADEQYRKMKHVETWRNDLYTVMVIRDHPNGFGDTIPDGMFELSIRRNDRGPILDWRHMQQIKNEIIGEENEAVQLHPAESRLVDTSNHFWLYGFNNPQVKFPFGMWNRAVDYTGDFENTEQRPEGEEL